MPTAHEHFSEQFQKWERRGRGWQVFAGPVSPEPPFQPFNGHYLPDVPAVDDGRRPTFLSSLFRKISQPPPPPPVVAEVEEEPEPTPLMRDSLVEFQASLTTDLDISSESFERFFRNVSLCREPVAFELLGTHKRVLAQFAASAEDASLVRRQLEAHFPDVPFRQVAGALEKAWEASEGDQAFAVEFGLEREFMFLLATGKIDPFVGIVGALAGLQPGELGLFQVLWQPVQNPWAESITNSVTHPDGKPFFVNAPELASAAENKVACPLYAGVVRMLLRTATAGRMQEIAREFGGSLRAYINLQGNALIPLHNDDYPSVEEHIDDVLRRQSRRGGMILNSDELIGFVHLPSSAVRSPALLRDAGKTKAAPIEVQQSSGLVIGDNEHNDETVPVYLTADQRVRHTHIIGIPGTGKSSLLFNLIRQDIEKGEGVGVLDPHGDLIDQILGIIPEHRIKDVVLVNLSDTEFPIGFNILQAHSEDEKTLLASDLVAVLQRFSSSKWGDQMDTVMQNAVLAFLYSSQGGNLADLRRFLLEAPKRGKFFTEFLQTVQDREIRDFWRDVFPPLGAGKSIGSVLARLQAFFSRKPLRNMVSQRKNMLDFEDIMDNRKIFLARLPEGLNGEENVYLLGSLLVAKFQQLAMARQSQEAADRKDFWLYVDEFDHFISPSMAQILTGARKYRLGMTLGHQELQQLQSDQKVASAVTSSVCTRIVLRVGDDDAKRLGEGFESFDAKSLKTLGKYHAIARIERNDWDFNLALRKPELPPKEQTDKRKAEVIAASRAAYGTPRTEVEAAWEAQLGSEISAPQSTESPKRGIAPAPTKPVETKPPTAPTDAASVVAEVPNPPPLAENRLEISDDSDDTDGLHTATKDAIQAEAETLDYTVLREKHFTALRARADLMLKRGKQLIVVQVTVTNSVNNEAESVRKLSKANFTHIAVISSDRKKLNSIRKNLAESGDKSEILGFWSPEEFMSKLSDWALDDPAGGAEERKNPRRNQTIDLLSGSLTEAEQKENNKRIWENLRKILKR